jgi:hypothetical protein
MPLPIQYNEHSPVRGGRRAAAWTNATRPSFLSLNLRADTERLGATRYKLVVSGGCSRSVAGVACRKRRRAQ